MSDSDSDSFHTPPSSLNQIEINEETLNRLLTEAIEQQDHERVLSVLTGSNKWIIEMRVWYLHGRQKVSIITMSLEVFEVILSFSWSVTVHKNSQ